MCSWNLKDSRHQNLQEIQFHLWATGVISKKLPVSVTAFWRKDLSLGSQISCPFLFSSSAFIQSKSLLCSEPRQYLMRARNHYFSVCLRAQCCIFLGAVLSLPAAASLLSLHPASEAAAPSPYVPSSGWTYAIEAIRSSPWPGCPYRFLSFPDSCDSVDLWRGAGSNQFWTLESASPSDSTVFYLRASCGSYLR